MGFSTLEIDRALEGYDGASGDAEAMIRYALKHVGK
jgi:hypothetical protein